jgi:hypothetical protein
MTTLKDSKDRKVANVVNAAGKQAAIANTFGLPSGADYSCGGITEVCAEVCYAGRLEKVFPSLRAALLHNWNLLKDASREEMATLLDEIIAKFVKASDKRGAEKIFRIHFDGDFFSEDYVSAWVDVMRKYDTVQFWVYTREAFAVRSLSLAQLPNLALYFSADRANFAVARAMRKTYGVRLAMLGTTFQEGQAMMKEITGKPGGKCPENLGSLPLISTEGSACARCRLCVVGKADVVFSATKK